MRGSFESGLTQRDLGSVDQCCKILVLIRVNFSCSRFLLQFVPGKSPGLPVAAPSPAPLVLLFRSSVCSTGQGGLCKTYGALNRYSGMGSCILRSTLALRYIRPGDLRSVPWGDTAVEKRNALSSRDPSSDRGWCILVRAPQRASRGESRRAMPKHSGSSSTGRRRD